MSYCRTVLLMKLVLAALSLGAGCGSSSKDGGGGSNTPYYDGTWTGTVPASRCLGRCSFGFKVSQESITAIWYDFSLAVASTSPDGCSAQGEVKCLASDPCANLQTPLGIENGRATYHAESADLSLDLKLYLESAVSADGYATIALTSCSTTPVDYTWTAASNSGRASKADGTHVVPQDGGACSPPDTCTADVCTFEGITSDCPPSAQCVVMGGSTGVCRPRS
jgi:hypothetical protein